jgi:hypothetical protein
VNGAVSRRENESAPRSDFNAYEFLEYHLRRFNERIDVFYVHIIILSF